MSQREGSASKSLPRINKKNRDEARVSDRGRKEVVEIRREGVGKAQLEKLGASSEFLSQRAQLWRTHLHVRAQMRAICANTRAHAELGAEFEFALTL